MVMRGLSSMSRIITSSESGVSTSPRRSSKDIRFKTTLVAVRDRAAGVSPKGSSTSGFDGITDLWKNGVTDYR